MADMEERPHMEEEPPHMEVEPPQVDEEPQQGGEPQEANVEELEEAPEVDEEDEEAPPQVEEEEEDTEAEEWRADEFIDTDSDEGTLRESDLGSVRRGQDGRGPRNNAFLHILGERAAWRHLAGMDLGWQLVQEDSDEDLQPDESIHLDVDSVVSSTGSSSDSSTSVESWDGSFMDMEDIGTLDPPLGLDGRNSLNAWRRKWREDIDKELSFYERAVLAARGVITGAREPALESVMEAGNRNHYECTLRLCIQEKMRTAIDDLITSKQKVRRPRSSSLGPGECPNREGKKRWMVIGGGGRGGLIVRCSATLGSSLLASRLETGSVIEEVEMDEEACRLRYRRVEGMSSGPETGWITTELNGRRLITEFYGPVPSSQAKARKKEKNLIIIAVVGATILNHTHLQRLEAALKTIDKQHLPNRVHFVPVVSWWAASGDLTEEVEDMLDGFTHIIGLQQSQQLSRFEHHAEALAAATRRAGCILASLYHGGESQARRKITNAIWVMFGSDEDLWHPRRVAGYVRAIREHKRLGSVAAFVTMSRATPASKTRAEPTTPADVDRLLQSGKAVRMDRIHSKDAAELSLNWGLQDCVKTWDKVNFEYFDYCSRLRVAMEFFSNACIVRHQFCNLRFEHFLKTYPYFGQELGLQLFFFQGCSWMYFHTPDSEATQLAKANGTQKWGGELMVDLRNPHVESSLQSVQRLLGGQKNRKAKPIDAERLSSRHPVDADLKRVFEYCLLEIEKVLVLHCGEVLDQAVLDGRIWESVCTCFEGYLHTSYQSGWNNLCMLFQSLAWSLADDLGTSVFKHSKGQFLWPDANARTRHRRNFQRGPL